MARVLQVNEYELQKWWKMKNGKYLGLGHRRLHYQGLCPTVNFLCSAVAGITQSPEDYVVLVVQQSLTIRSSESLTSTR